MAKTEELQGIEGEGVGPVKKIKSLDTAIDEWRSIVEKRMKLTESEVEASQKVTDLMHKHNLTAYPYWVDDETQKLVVLEGKEKLKLKKADASDSNEPSETDVNDD